jgi:hypothetical protein
MHQKSSDHLLPAQTLALCVLVDELSELADWPDVEVDAVLLLHDVLTALNATSDDRVAILGDVACLYVKYQLNDRVSRKNRELCEFIRNDKEPAT